MPWAAVGAAVAGAATSAALAPSPGSPGTSGAAAAAADPFAAERPQYQQALAQLMGTGHSDMGVDPSSGFRFGEGKQAVERSSAATGMFGSGNMGQALVKYGQDFASTEYANQFSRLAQLAGGNIGNPGTAGQILAGQAASDQQGRDAFGAAIGKAVGNTNWGNVLGGGTGGGQPVNLGTVTGADMDVAY